MALAAAYQGPRHWRPEDEGQQVPPGGQDSLSQTVGEFREVQALSSSQAVPQHRSGAHSAGVWKEPLLHTGSFVCPCLPVELLNIFFQVWDNPTKRNLTGIMSRLRRSKVRCDRTVLVLHLYQLVTSAPSLSRKYEQEHGSYSEDLQRPLPGTITGLVESTGYV